MDALFKKIFQDLLLGILKLIDGITQLFNIVLGLEEVQVSDGATAQPVNLVDWFIRQDIIVQVFVTLFVISILLVGVCCIAAIIKSIFHSGDGERKPATRVVGQGMRSLLTTLFIGIITFSAIGGANSLLGVVHKAVGGNSTQPMSISRVILELGLSPGVTYDYKTMGYIREYQINGTLPDDATDVNGNYVNNESAVNNALNDNGNIWDTENGAWRWFVMKDVPKDANGRFGIISQEKFDNLFQGGYLKPSVTATEIWGTYEVNAFGIVTGGWNNNGAALYGDAYGLFPAYIAAVMMIIILIVTSFNLVKRLFDIINLFFVLPFVNACVPLDDGAHMKLWRETMISKVILAYGVVFAWGVFSIFAPLCNSVQLGADSMLTSTLRLILICGAGLSIQGGMLLFSRLVGTGIAEGGEMAQTARLLLTAGAGALLLGGKAISFAKNKSKNLEKTVKDRFSLDDTVNDANMRYTSPATTATPRVDNILRTVTANPTQAQPAMITPTPTAAPQVDDGHFTAPPTPPTAPLNLNSEDTSSWD